MNDNRQGEGRSDAGAWIMVSILTLAFTVSFIDRQILNLLVGPLKDAFDLSDTKLSLLQGVAFTSAYILFSGPFGRLADTGNRRGILLLGVALWSAATAFCGLARSYLQLFVARFGVGGAEASLTPAAWSMIADRFPAQQVPRAMSIYLMGPYIGSGLALIFGGLLLGLSEGQTFFGLAPWQFVFVMAALPGALVILLLIFFVREPARQSSRGGESEQPMTLSQVMDRFRKERRFYLNFYCGMSGIVISLYAFPAWMPTLLIRKFAASASEVGIQYGVLVLIGGSAGVLSGPIVSRWLERSGRKDALMVVPLFAACGLAALSLLLPFADSYAFVLAIAGLVSFTYSLPTALAASALQLVTPNRMRGMASAVYIFIISVIGLGLAPTIVALITDIGFADEARVGESLAITCCVSALAGLVMLSRARAAYADLLTRNASAG
ncbi:MFS transporter [Sphingobium phenoxybenzoativorans]|uniref:MFS transporter n=1 Tax=Sphingobium phenoxybenzoativorans TaxID=1592790 RepID=A0A975K5W2_9SPHN|nr:MFS transporter [Sphingobium phenoxybenzoativorans]QUT05057.1 MFS transporter [Sphingobium phenoxybenzoativorans]